MMKFLPGILLSLTAACVYVIAERNKETLSDLKSKLQAILSKKWEETTPEDWIACAELRDRIKAWRNV